MRKARAGIVPAAKPGRRWVFLEDDLRIYLAKLVRERACRSIASLRAPTGGSDSASVVSRLDAALAQRIEQPRKNSKPNFETITGGRRSSASDRGTPGPRPSSDGRPKLRLVGEREIGSA